MVTRMFTSKAAIEWQTATGSIGSEQEADKEQERILDGCFAVTGDSLELEHGDSKFKETIRGLLRVEKTGT